MRRAPVETARRYQLASPTGLPPLPQYREAMTTSRPLRSISVSRTGISSGGCWRSPSMTTQNSARTERHSFHDRPAQACDGLGPVDHADRKRRLGGRLHDGARGVVGRVVHENEFNIDAAACLRCPVDQRPDVRGFVARGDDHGGLHGCAPSGLGSGLVTRRTLHSPKAWTSSEFSRSCVDPAEPRLATLEGHRRTHDGQSISCHPPGCSRTIASSRSGFRWQSSSGVVPAAGKFRSYHME